MMPEVPVDQPDYDYTTWLLFGGEAAGTFDVKSGFGNQPCEVAIVSIANDIASTSKLEEGSNIIANNRGNGARMFYCEFGGAGTITPPIVWIPTSGNMKFTHDGLHGYICLIFRRKAKIRHINPPLPSTHPYDSHAVHVAHEEDVNARKC